MNLNEAIQFANKTVKAYVDGVIDHQSFRDTLAAIPVELWRDRDVALHLITAMVENEKLYEVSG